MGLATGVAIANSMDNFKHLNGSFSKSIIKQKEPLDYVPYFYKWVNYRQPAPKLESVLGVPKSEEDAKKFEEISGLISRVELLKVKYF